MRTQKEIEVRIEGIKETLVELNQELDELSIDEQRDSEIFADIVQLSDRKKILEWVLGSS